MIPLSRHSAQILDGAGQPVLDPVAVSLTLDESWSPRLQGTLTIPFELLYLKLGSQLGHARLILWKDRVRWKVGVGIGSYATQLCGDVVNDGLAPVVKVRLS